MMKRQNSNIPEDRNRISKILLVFYWVLLFASVAVIAKIIYIQYIWEPDPQTLENFIPKNEKVEIKPERGDIMDCNRRLLASSTPLYTIRLDCQIQKKEMAKGAIQMGRDTLTEEIWRRLARETCDRLPEIVGGSTTAKEYYDLILINRDSKDRRGRRNVKFIKDIDHSTLLKIKQLPLFRLSPRFSGMMTDVRDARKYPYGELGRRLIGDVRIDPNEPERNRFLGIEGQYDYILHGKEGIRWMKATDKGAILNPDSTSVEVEHGADVISTIDIGIQDIADKALRRHIGEDEAIEGGCVVVMDVQTGAVKAMVNLKKNSKGELGEYFNMAIGRAGEPGSIFKTATLMTLLEDGKVTLDTEIRTNGGKLEGYPKVPVDEALRNYEKQTGRRSISVREGFKRSSNNVFRYLTIEHYGEDEHTRKQFTDRLFEYNLHNAYEFDLTEKGGSRSSLRDSWTIHDLYSTAIGYSIRETPLNMLAFYNAIANKGKMMKPYVISAFEKNGHVEKEFKPVILNGSICSKRTADTLTTALKAVAQEGTARRLKNAKCAIAGKTGTARVVLEPEDKPKRNNPYVNEEEYKKYQATFVGFFPADDPKYSAIVTVYTGLTRSNGYGGGNHPAKVFGEVVDNLWALDSDWGNRIGERGRIPQMREAYIGTRQGGGPVPDVRDMGLKDAIYALENNGYRCVYEGIGHVASQSPAAGTRCKAGTTVHIRLK
ncbi:MAG: PASTA domain-containing protein [Bacteroidales bacterium]|nr:PASTA domain-containing protein [Bacteroidales bacterium]